MAKDDRGAENIYWAGERLAVGSFRDAVQ